MNTKKKSTKKTAAADTTAAAKTTTTTSTASTTSTVVAKTAPVAAPAVVAAPVVTKPVVAAPVTTPVAAKAVSVAPTQVELPVVKAAAKGNTPVEVLLKKATAEQLMATIRYQGPLAKDADKVVAVLGTEFFGCRRWEGCQDVVMNRSKDGAFEAEVALSGKNASDRALMALQLAFTTPTRTNWDSAGVPYGYYQVSTVTGTVEAVPH